MCHWGNVCLGGTGVHQGSSPGPRRPQSKAQEPQFLTPPPPSPLHPLPPA